MTVLDDVGQISCTESSQSQEPRMLHHGTFSQLYQPQQTLATERIGRERTQARNGARLPRCASLSLGVGRALLVVSKPTYWVEIKYSMSGVAGVAPDHPCSVRVSRAAVSLAIQTCTLHLMLLN
jgi:hypothetical protein